MESAPIQNPTDLCVLYALADRASDDGTGAYPSREWIAERARVSVSTVSRRLNHLKDSGVISLGDQSLVSHYRPDRRPIVYDLNLRGVNLERGVKSDNTGCQNGTNGVSNSGVRGVNVDTQTVHNHPEPKDKPPEGSNQFNEWWEVWPKKVAKGGARTAYKTAMKKTTHETLMGRTRAAVKLWERDRTEKKFIPFPATWLNQERWEDETLIEASATPDDLYAAAIADPSNIGSLLSATGMSGPVIEFDGRPRDVVVTEANKRWLQDNEERIRANLSRHAA